VKVSVTWAVHQSRFHCSVEDSGPGITADLSASYLPFDALKLGVTQGEGLRALWTIVRSSSGLLLFRRSPALGGTQAFIELPVLGYWIHGQLHRFENAYGS
jgi:C4-dicarboxylate-specific signal transduction histidine kinase